MNMPEEIYMACTAGGDIDSATYVALHSTIDLAGMWDLIEMAQVNSSWKIAAMKNSKEE
jgi:hypothetical protein